MSPLEIVRAAGRRVHRAPAILLGVWLMTLIAAVPMAIIVRTAIAQHLGTSLEAEKVAAGASHDWMLELGEQASGVAATFTAAVLGFAAPLDTLSRLVDGASLPPALVAVGVVSALLWTFLAGGIIDRYARDRPTGAHGFFQACGGHFGPLLRLAIFGAVVNGVLLFSWRPWLLGTMYDRITRDVDAERTAAAVRIAFYLLFVTALAIVHLVFDYARVRVVVEDRRSAVGALKAAIGFIRRNRLGTLGVYALNVVMIGVVLAVYSQADPGAGGGEGWQLASVFALGQLYIVARVWTRLAFWASEIEWFFSRLAHSGYQPRAHPQRPEPPIVERALRIDGTGTRAPR